MHYSNNVYLEGSANGNENLSFFDINQGFFRPFSNLNSNLIESVKKLNEKNLYINATEIHITYKIKDAELNLVAQPREYEDAVLFS